MELRPGIYENIITQGLKEKIADLSEGFTAEEGTLDTEESTFTLALHLTRLIAGQLDSFRGEDRTKKQADFFNQIVECVARNSRSGHSADSEKIFEDLRYLMQVKDERFPALIRPDTPLTNAALFTGTSSDLTLESELKKEILSADRIDILCSFIKWSGLRLLLPALREADASGKPIRILTTSYLGATDLKAVEELRKLSHAELFVSYDTQRTRLHAKSYIFHRENGFGTAYIGSSNISAPALTSGLEWNLKISQFESPYLWKKICATFETYQNTTEFSPYGEGSRERLAQALAHERGGDGKETDLMAFMDVFPYPYQEEILDKVLAERKLHGRNRNLIAAATGTGKTVISAFDFKRFRREYPNAKFLFIAHREEILKQSLCTFRNILRDQNFGELLVGQERPKEWNALFASIQSINSHALCRQFEAEYFDYIVIDEFHHAAADSYQEVLEHFQPKQLLALTATPERHDGLDILKYFDGRIAAEIRLPDAVNKKLLAPFQYFGLTDSVDLSGVKWTRGGYDRTELNIQLAANMNRANLVLQKMHEILLDVRQSRCLCFCVSQEHAEFMSRVFNENGIPAAALTSRSSAEERRKLPRRLISRELNIICAVDIFNEGVDIPEIDTVLFLRPTESLTVFLQQLGRGLRLHDEKECLTVLDFVGNAHRNFNWEGRFRALLGTTGLSVSDEVRQGFPHLPAGCHIQLERQAKEYILRNIKNGISSHQKNILRRLAEFENESGKPLTLANFLDFHTLTPITIYQKGLFCRLCEKAGVRQEVFVPKSSEERFQKGLKRICHWNSVSMLRSVRSLLCAPQERLENLNETEKRLLTMLHFGIWGNYSSELPSLSESIARMKAGGTFFPELLELLDYLAERTDTITRTAELDFPCPLEIHADYTRDEILAGLGYWRFGKTPDMREGVLYIPEINADCFFITLNKSEKQYSPTTMYLDYALNDRLFHWQSQSTTSANSATGKRYLNGKSTVLLFVRENKNTHGQSTPYTFLGPAEYVRHRGSKPISIEWSLLCPMPARLVRKTRRLDAA